LGITSALSMNPWIGCPKPNPQARLRLFCFPYAGGGASIYRSWPDGLPQSVEVCAIQLPGRERRLLEPPFTNLGLLVETIAQSILPYLDKPFAFFGHSMGAKISFELAQRLLTNNTLTPTHLFISASRAPHLPTRRRPLHDLPEDEFIEELRLLNGTPKEVLEHPELMKLMIPILRADFSINETYQHSAAPALDLPITAFGGLQDQNVSREDLEAWRDYTSASFTTRMLPGDHFFIHVSQSVLLRAVSEDLHRVLKGSA
jgi:medium-chain acyl-[acyl-carrier-protein] hydrolase